MEKFSKKFVSLTGFMGCGKSTLLKELARRTQIHTVDLDQFIEKRYGRPISELIKNKEQFRDFEHKALHEIFGKSPIPTLIALGGGTLLNEESRSLVLENTHMVYIECRPKALKMRLKREPRPLMQNSSFDDLFDEREPHYKLAQDRISNNGTLLTATNALIDVLQKNCYLES